MDMFREARDYSRYMGYSAEDLYDSQESDVCIICGREHDDVCETCRKCPRLCECDAALITGVSDE